MDEEMKILALVDNAALQNIADAIRTKTGGSNTYTPRQMATAIEGISTGVKLPTLTDPATTSEVFEDKEYIDSDGITKQLKMIP